MAAITKNKRRDMDIMKLMMSDFQVQLTNEENLHDFSVKFRGPKDTPYEDGIWKVHVVLPSDYPFKSPSIGFVNQIFHPNVDLSSGSVCLDIINQTWSPMFDLVNIFEVFLPQLLRYPNPSDPLNQFAAQLLLQDADEYELKVKGTCVSIAEKLEGNLREIEYVKECASLDIDLTQNQDMSDVSDMSDMED